MVRLGMELTPALNAAREYMPAEPGLNLGNHVLACCGGSMALLSCREIQAASYTGGIDQQLQLGVSASDHQLRRARSQGLWVP